MSIDKLKTDKAKAAEHYERGLELRREGRMAEAADEFMAALALDAESPARVALEMLSDIFGFYHRDAYNP